MFESSEFPRMRMRRLRYNDQLRNLVQETRLDVGRLILPLFVRAGSGSKQPIASMPGHAQLTVAHLEAELEDVQRLGIGGVILFGIPAEKDAVGSDACSGDGIIQEAIRECKRVAPELLVISDVCFCEYTDHGHCGVIREHAGRPDVSNDETLKLLGQQAVTHAQAGVDVVAPSGMMDGMVRGIRDALDENQFSEIPILSYAAKYCSAFYGPFRDAAESAPQFGNRKTYQMDPAAAVGQALREVQLDIQEGADMIMVKPALPYLDIIRLTHEQFPGVPIAAYNVSGEYSMVKAAAANGWLDEQATAMECLTAIHRAGASIILTYWAKEVANWLADP